MQARTLKIIAALLIISAIIMGVIGYRISQEDSQRQARAAQSTVSEAGSYTYAQKLVVANKNLLEGEVITEEDLLVVPYPVTIDNGFSKIADLVGTRPTHDIAKGSPVRATDFDAPATLTTQISAGHRAVAIKVDEVIGTGGFLKPGDYVDVIFTTRASKETLNRSMSRRVLKNVRLLAFGASLDGEREPLSGEDGKSKSNNDKDSGKRSKSAVLEVELDDVNRLILAERSGDLRLIAIGDDERLAQDDASGESAIADRGTEIDDKATLMREVTGFKPPPPPKSVYVYNGDKVETIRVPK